MKKIISFSITICLLVSTCFLGETEFSFAEETLPEETNNECDIPTKENELLDSPNEEPENLSEGMEDVIASQKEQLEFEGEEQAEYPKVVINTKDGRGNFLVKASGYSEATISVSEEGMDSLEKPGQIKVRGNTTAGAEKKPFTIKFNEKQNLFKMGKAKKWVLLANCFDPTLLRNKLVFDFATSLKLHYVSETKFVDLWLDGVYKGNYLLIEQVESGSKRIDINTEDKEDGYSGDFIIESEAVRTESGEQYLTTSKFGYRFNLQEPEKAKRETITSINNRLTQIETAISSGELENVRQYVDIDSFVDFYIMNEFFKTVDVGYSSTYFYFKDGVLYAGPPWDYDLSSGNASGAYRDYNNATTTYNSVEGLWAVRGPWYKELLKYNEFQDAIKTRYLELQPEIRSIYSDGGKIDALISDNRESFDRNFSTAGWKVNKIYLGYMRTPDSTYDQNVAFLKTWLQKRNEWLLDWWHLAAEPLEHRDYMVSNMNTDGSFEHYYCPICHRYYSDSEGKNEVGKYQAIIPRVTAIAPATAIYDGKIKAPNVTVYGESQVLVRNVDYTVAYSGARKKIGTYTLTIYGKGNYTGAKSVAFNIVPQSVKLRSMSRGSKRVTVKWNRPNKLNYKQINGYQIRYSKNSNFAGAKYVNVGKKSTSRTIKKLSRKTTYFLQVRTYKKVGKTRYYSPWSNVKSARTK